MLQDATFENNAGTYGGAARVASGALVSIHNSGFYENMAAVGSAVLVAEGGTVEALSACRFVNNTQLLEHADAEHGVVQPLKVFTDWAVAKFAARCARLGNARLATASSLTKQSD